ncbi:MAG TPA: sugar phosphate isomerase/epimerase family protein [Clostridiales bacterium]|nr:sugar phosphate isomerase/epimerase family protein [Clostridiales bacterium]
MKKAINAWSVPSHITFEEMFRDISNAGFDGIELNLDADNYSSHSLTMSSGKEIFTEINHLAEEYNLPIASISTSLSGGKLGSDSKDVRESGKDIIRKQMECAAELGADGVLTVPGGMTDSISLLQAYENSFMAIEELKSEIESAKINVGLENVWNGFFISPFDMKNFIDRLDCPYIGAYFDVGNVIAFSNPEYWIEILSTCIRKIHVKDFKRSNGINRGGCFVNLLEGDANWSKVIPALRKTGYNGYLTAELGIIKDCPEYLYKITSDALDIIINISSSR